MKIMTWNCQGAFRKKAEFILPLRPDILVVQECEHPDKLLFNSGFNNPTTFYGLAKINIKDLAYFHTVNTNLNFWNSTRLTSK